MEFISIFFILLSIVVIGYVLYSAFHGKRVHLLFELFFLGAYCFVALIFLFPQILRVIENVLGIQSAINFIIYLSIFVAYFLLLLFYNKTEEQRQEITKLTREIALLRKNKK